MSDRTAVGRYGDRELEAFRKAVRDVLTVGFDAELLADEIAAIWKKEFEGDEEDDNV